MAPLLDLRPDHEVLVLDIVSAGLADAKVWAFGSRARRNSSKTSDLDLAVRAPEPLTFERTARLQSLFEESSLPFRVDIVDLHRVDDDFGKAIAEERILISRPRAEKADRKARLLSDCVDFLAGGTPSEKEAGFWGGSIPWVAVDDLRRGFLVSETERRVTPAAVEEGHTYLAPAGSTLISIRGADVPGPMCLTSREMAFSKDIRAVIPRRDILHPPFLRFALLEKRAYLEMLASKRPIPHLRTTDFYDLPLAIPSLKEQKRISELLTAREERTELKPPGRS